MLQKSYTCLCVKSKPHPLNFYLFVKRILDNKPHLPCCGAYASKPDSTVCMGERVSSGRKDVQLSVQFVDCFPSFSNCSMRILSISRGRTMTMLCIESTVSQGLSSSSSHNHLHPWSQCLLKCNARHCVLSLMCTPPLIL